MSGIAGLIRFDGGPVESTLIRSMGDALAHRGPDGRGEWVKGSVGLTQVALHTTAESLEERQPLANEDESLVLVMDGWLSNWEELRQELLGCGARLRDRSDAELVLRAYEEWGSEHCLDHIDGDFALVFWDARERRAVCARDRVGNKPFLYRWDGATLAFASELHAILALPGAPRRLNEGFIVDLLASEWHSTTDTLWNCVVRLPAATRMRVGQGGTVATPYWEPRINRPAPHPTDLEYVESYRQFLRDCVRRQARSHRPVAFEVSGGLDSSAVFAMAEDLRRAAELLSPSIHGFTLSFEGSKDSPELTRAAQDLPYARALSRHLRVPIQEVSGTDVPLEWFAEAVSFYFDFPGYPNETMCLGLRKAAKDAGCRVLVTGSGGDQWLSGSRLYYAEELAAAKWRTLWELWSLDRRQFGVGPAITYLVRQGILPLAPRALLNGLRALRSVTQRKSVESRPWLSPRGREILEERRAATGRASEALAARPPRERALLLQLADPFTAFARELEDRAAARLQLELRHPFWSPELAQYVFLMPERLRLRGHEDRYLHRRALRGLLPARITSRRTKGEFSIAFSRVLAQVGCEPIAAIARRRPDWISPSGPSSLAELARDPNDPVGAMWAIWQAICCDMIATAAGIDGPDEATWTGGTR